MVLNATTNIETDSVLVVVFNITNVPKHFSYCKVGLYRIMPNCISDVQHHTRGNINMIYSLLVMVF